MGILRSNQLKVHPRTGLSAGFTLLEVLVAMAITAFVSLVAYTSLSTAISGAESARRVAQQIHELNRAFSMLSRDLRQVVNRPVVDEFGQIVPALIGGELAQEWLVMTRAGWHNSSGAPRSTLQRISWRVQDGQLIRSYYPVLDRTPGTDPIETLVLQNIEGIGILFLPALGEIESDRNDVIDRRMWEENWIFDLSQPNADLMPPAAVEIRLEIAGVGEIRQTYVLPSF